MTALKTTLLALGLSSLSGLAMAAGNPLSVHVLNLENGIPTPGIEVTLEHQSKGQWQELSRGKTNEQGRITALYPEGKALAAGDYRVVFKTGDYYAGAKRDTFFPEIPVLFKVENTEHTVAESPHQEVLSQHQDSRQQEDLRHAGGLLWRDRRCGGSEEW